MGPFYEAEKNKLGIESQSETREPVTAIPIPTEFGPPNWTSQDTPVTAEAHNLGLTGRIQDPEPTSAVPAQSVDTPAVRELPGQVVGAWDLTAKPVYGDLEFQKKVIAAFKHLGLDTKKFFGA
jgi:hypothetical protein